MEALILLKVLVTTIPVGFVAALMGIGGGSLIIPILVTFFQIDIKEAIAVSIVMVIATSISGSSRYLKQGITNVRLGIFLELTTAIGAAVGAVITTLAPSYFLYLLLSILLYYLSFIQIRTSRLEFEKVRYEKFTLLEEDSIARVLHLSDRYYDRAEGKYIDYNVCNSFKGLISSFMAGICSGMLGIGGGVLKVPIMNTLMNIPMKVAIATSKFMMGITASTGALIYLMTGYVNLELVSSTVLGVAIGALIGASIMNRVQANKLKILFGILLLYFAYLMLARGISILVGWRLPGA